MDGKVEVNSKWKFVNKSEHFPEPFNKLIGEVFIIDSVSQYSDVISFHSEEPITVVFNGGVYNLSDRYCSSITERDLKTYFKRVVHSDWPEWL